MADGNGLNQGPNFQCEKADGLGYIQVRRQAAQVDSSLELYLKALAKLKRIETELKEAQHALRSADENLARLLPYPADDLLIHTWVDGNAVVFKLKGEPEYKGFDIDVLPIETPESVLQEELYQHKALIGSDDADETLKALLAEDDPESLLAKAIEEEGPEPFYC